MNQEIITQTELKEIENPKTYSITLNAEQRKLIKYTGLTLVGLFVARYLIKSAVKSIREE